MCIYYAMVGISLDPPVIGEDPFPCLRAFERGPELFLDLHVSTRGIVGLAHLPLGLLF